MKRLSHAELVAASTREDWSTLWGAAQSTVKLVVGRMARNGAIRAEDVEDMEQEGMLIADEAVRSWRPLECALSTWVGNQVRWGLSEFAGRERNHGIGSHEQETPVLSMGDARDEGGREAGPDDEDDGDDGSFEAALTYGGVFRRYTGQIDGEGDTPEGFGDPVDEADRARNVASVRAGAAGLRDTAERDAVVAVLHGEHPESYARRKQVTARTVRNWLQSARRKLSKKLQNSGHK